MSDLSLSCPSDVSRRTQRIWEQIALQLWEEQNPVKLVALWRDLDKAMSEGETLSRSQEASGLSYPLDI